MKLTWYGTASLVIETQKAVLAFDPYLKELPKTEENEAAKEARLAVFKRQKNVFITHGHLDHFSHVKKIYKDVDCKIYLTKSPYRSIIGKNFTKDKLFMIAPGDEITVGDVKIFVKKGKHIQFVNGETAKIIRKNFFKRFKALVKIGFLYFKYPERGEIVLYELHCEGKVVQIMGSAGLLDGVDYTVGADVLILPHQGRNDIDEHNEKIVEKLKPKRILLDHYDDSFPPYSKDVFVDGFCEKMSKTIPTEKLVEGVTVEI